MCTYVLLIPTCHHNPLLLFDASCRLIIRQLQRINHLAAWEDSALGEIPFTVPESCLPAPEIIQPIYTSDSCRLDCHYVPEIALVDNMFPATVFPSGRADGDPTMAGELEIWDPGSE
ncbi:hypothetical protein ColKHC_04872 [Colletotrichum higginsianum]|nr:hypothetical protein ColKHC_04872 [Colletotrichum higginsianum]